MKSTRILLLITAVLSSLFIGAEVEFPPDLIARIESNFFSSHDFSAQLTVIKNIGTELEDLEQYYLFRKDAKGFLLLLQRKPEAVKGRAYLLKNGELWLYNPYGQGFSRATLAQNISNSTALVSDIAALSFTRDYRIQEFKPAVLGSYDVDVVELLAKESSHPVPRLTLWIEQTDYLPLKIKAVNGKGMPERTIYYHKYTQIAEQIYPVSIYIEDAADPVKKTQLIFSQFNISSLPDFVFTRAYVEEINKE